MLALASDENGPLFWYPPPQGVDWDLNGDPCFTAGTHWVDRDRKESPTRKRGAFCYYCENPHTFGQVINHRWSLTVYSSFSGCLTWDPRGWFAKCWVLEAVIEVAGSCALNIDWAIKTLSTQKHQTGTPKSVGPLTLISPWLSSPSVKWKQQTEKKLLNFFYKQSFRCHLLKGLHLWHQYFNFLYSLCVGWNKVRSVQKIQRLITAVWK